MADVVKHTFVSSLADGTDATLVRPSNWNAEHAFSGGTSGQVLVRDPTATDGASWGDSVPALFEIDIDGGLEPVTAVLTDAQFELDANDDIEPKA